MHAQFDDSYEAYSRQVAAWCRISGAARIAPLRASQLKSIPPKPTAELPATSRAFRLEYAYWLREET